MLLTPELLGAAAVGIVVILGAIGQYLRSLKEKPRGIDPVLTGVGLGWGEKDSVVQLKRIADALDILVDRRAEETEELHNRLLKHLDMQERREEQEEQVPRRHPPPKRR